MMQEKDGLLSSYRSSSPGVDDQSQYSHERKGKISCAHFYHAGLVLLLVASLILNVVLVVDGDQVERRARSVREKTPYAGLEYTANGTWAYDSVYAQDNLTAADEEWLKLNIDHAFVALTKDDSDKMDLPASLPFPWDAGKSLYLLTSIHSIHCLQILHLSNLEYRTQHTQTYTTEHLLHCLDNLRTDLMCSADDTPRYVPADSTLSTAKTGVGQARQCRDWNQLEQWAKDHSACFNYNEFERKELEEERVYPSAWSYCSQDSQYLSQVQRFFGRASDWVPADKGRPDIDEIRHQND